LFCPAFFASFHHSYIIEQIIKFTISLKGKKNDKKTKDH